MLKCPEACPPLSSPWGWPVRDRSPWCEDQTPGRSAPRARASTHSLPVTLVWHPTVPALPLPGTQPACHLAWPRCEKRRGLASAQTWRRRARPFVGAACVCPQCSTPRPPAWGSCTGATASEEASRCNAVTEWGHGGQLRPAGPAALVETPERCLCREGTASRWPWESQEEGPCQTPAMLAPWPGASHLQSHEK